MQMANETKENDLEIISESDATMNETAEKEFKKNKFDTSDFEAVKKALISTPKLLQRPVLINSKNAVIGRPPEI